MIKKHFIAIAAGFKARLKALTHDSGEVTIEFETRYHELLRCAHMFADIATADNPRFDRQRFLAACGF